MNISSDRNNRSIINNLCVLFFLFVVFLTPFFALPLGGKDILCLLSFGANGLVFIGGIFFTQRKHAFSLGLIYWIFMFFFMYYAPLIQYLLSVFPWQGLLTDDDVLATNGVVFLFNAVFAASGVVAARVKVEGYKQTDFSGFLSSGFAFQKKGKIIMTLIVCLLTAYSLSRTGFLGIVVARTQAVQAFYSGDNSAVELIVEAIIPSLIAYTVTEATQGMVSKKEKWIRFAVLLLCLLICFFPTTIPRYKTAAIYGAVFLVLFPQIKKGSKFFWIFILAMFFAFPLLNSVRRAISLESMQAVFQDGLLSPYLEADYDAYRMLASSIKYVGSNGIAWGTQLLGAILFFVPRSIWPSKPVGSGAMLIQSEFGVDTFSNVSCPFIAEGYINFGIVGVIVFAMLLGIFIEKIDTQYWLNTADRYGVVFSPYLYLVFMLFFVLRGDLLSSFAYTCGFMLTGFLLKKIAKHL